MEWKGSVFWTGIHTQGEYNSPVYYDVNADDKSITFTSDYHDQHDR